MLSSFLLVERGEAKARSTEESRRGGDLHPRGAIAVIAPTARQINYLYDYSEDIYSRDFSRYMCEQSVLYIVVYVKRA